jgi:hypothetical protein
MVLSYHGARGKMRKSRRSKVSGKKHGFPVREMSQSVDFAVGGCYNDA